MTRQGAAAGVERRGALGDRQERAVPRLLHRGSSAICFRRSTARSRSPRRSARAGASRRARAGASSARPSSTTADGSRRARPLLSLLALRGAPTTIAGSSAGSTCRPRRSLPAGPHAASPPGPRAHEPAGTGRRSRGTGGRGQAHRWLLSGELRQAGEWQRRTDAPAGGWSHEFAAQHVLDIKATCSVLDTLGALPQGSRFAPEAWAATRRACEIMLAMQEPDGSFARFERGESDVWMSRLPWRDASILAAGPRFSREQIQVTARVLHRLAELGWKPDDDRIARGLRWLERRCEDELGELDLVTLADLARCFGALQPREHGLRRGLEETVRGRQREDGSFGALCHTAVGLRALMDAQGGLCIQSERAARQLAGALAARSAAAEDGAPPFVDHARVPGLGLCSHCEDPALGVREAGAALRSFAERGGARLRIET
ncbi:MAG: hypothetical protein R3A51_06925 [Nannocystaceae bacterium]